MVLSRFVFFACLFSSAWAAPCDVSGNWTSSKSAKGAVHIEVHQDANNRIAVRATPWGAKTGFGSVNDHSAEIVMVGASSPTKSEVTKSPHQGPDKKDAPDCTQMFGWCKFPYCGFDMPLWKPWPKPEPTPGPTPPTPPPPPTPAPGPKSCAVTRSCPPPDWTPSYAMNLSTVAQPCNATDYFSQGSEFGMVSFDWSNAKQVWSKNPNTLTNCSEMLVEQAKRVKTASPSTKVFVYRNFELALEWIRGQRQHMLDPTKAGFFLQYQTGPKKGLVYDEDQFNGLHQYFWDFRNESAVDAFLADAVGEDAVGNQFVDGIFTDDVTGDFQEHGKAIASMGFTKEVEATIVDANQRAYTKIITALIAKKAYNWQAFGAGDGTSPNPLPTSQSACKAAMETLCPVGTMQKKPALLTAGKHDSHLSKTMVAAFMIVRGPFWWLGTGWQGCSDAPTTWQEDPLLQIDPGIPTGVCKEVGSGTYSRSFTKGTATLDCNTWTATLDFK